MWQIRLFNSKHFRENNYHLMKLLKEVEEEPNTHEILEINGVTYHWNAVSHKNKIIGVTEITLVPDDEVEEQNEDEFTCPYCLSEYADAFELSDNGTTKCGNCGSEIEYEREITITYRVIPVKRNNVVKL